MATLDSQGLTTDSLLEIQQRIEDRQRQEIDPNIYTRDDELLGQLNKIFSERFRAIQELVEAVYSSGDIDEAEDTSLGVLAKLRNTERLPGTPTQGNQSYRGAEGTTIPLGAIVANPSTEDRFTTTSSLLLDSGSCEEVYLTASPLTASTEYSVEFSGGLTSSYTSGGTPPTQIEVLSELATDINDNVTGYSAEVTEDEELRVYRTLSTQKVLVQTLSNLSVQSVTDGVNIEAEEVGPIIALSNTVTQIITQVSGITSTTNKVPLTKGDDVESDEIFRNRITSYRTDDPIYTGLINNVPGIIRLFIQDNDTSYTVDGIPPHSYEVVVSGGDDAAIAAELWRTNAYGIGFHGNTEVVITDASGVDRVIKFSRPAVINLAVRVTYTTYEEEVLPETFINDIQLAVFNYVQDLGEGVDVIPGRIKGPIYNSTTGLDSLTIEIQTLTNPGGTPNNGSWQQSRLSVSPSDAVSITLADIYVQEE